jgi:hypothetical protein
VTLDRANLARSVGGPACVLRPVSERPRTSQIARRYWASGPISKLVGRFGLLTVNNSMERHPYSRGDTPAGQWPEHYVGRRELAEIMGVSLATVDRMVGEGMPSVTWGRRTRRFRPSAAISWASERRRVA